MLEANLYQCPLCGLHYAGEELAKECEEFCLVNNACNLEITRNSIEAIQNSQSS